MSARPRYLIDLRVPEILHGPAPTEECRREMHARGRGCVVREDHLMVAELLGGAPAPAPASAPGRLPHQEPYPIPCIDCGAEIVIDPLARRLHVKCEPCRAGQPAPARPAEAAPAPPPPPKGQLSLF